MSSMLEKFSHLLYKPEAPIYQFLHAGCWVLMSFGTALAHATVCGHHEVYVSDLDSCQKCNFCCNKTRNGYITNLTPETKCIDLKKGSYLYACLETEGEDVCSSRTYPGDNDVAVTDIPYWIPVPLGLCLVVILALLFYFYCWRRRQKKRQASPKDVTLTNVKIVSQLDSQKDEETPQEQENLVEAVQDTNEGNELSRKVVSATAESLGSMVDNETSVHSDGEQPVEEEPEDEEPNVTMPLLADEEETQVKTATLDSYDDALVAGKFHPLRSEAKPGAAK